MNEEQISMRLISEFNYPPHAAKAVAAKAMKLSPDTDLAFKMWWNKGQLPELKVEGYTIERLMEEHGMNPIASILTLDWLVREPAKALQSLRKGHDVVGST